METNRRKFFQKCVILGMGFSLGAKKLMAKNDSKSSGKEINNIFDVIKNRRSVRKYKSTPIPKEHLMKILEAGNYAPTPRNRQAWKFVVIQEKETIDQIRESCIKKAGKDSRGYYTDFLSAPTYVVVFAHIKTKNPVNDITAAALAAENMLLAARSLGYGTVFAVNSVPEEIVVAELKVPDDYQYICVIPIGVPVEWPEPKKKKSLEEVVLYEKFE